MVENLKLILWYKMLFWTHSFQVDMPKTSPAVKFPSKAQKNFNWTKGRLFVITNYRRFLNKENSKATYMPLYHLISMCIQTGPWLYLVLGIALFQAQDFTMWAQCEVSLHNTIKPTTYMTLSCTQTKHPSAVVAEMDMHFFHKRTYFSVPDRVSHS